MKRWCVIACLALVAPSCVVGRGGVLNGNGVELDGGRDRRDGSTSGRRDGSVDGSPDGGPPGFDAAAFPDGSLLATEIYCDDGVDQDGDGMLDCADLDCSGVACDSMGSYCIGGTCGGCAGEAVETDCGDGADEDCDGMTDCADDDCDGAVCGPGDVVCGGGACPCVSGFVERLCGDAADDDCDSLVDCADPDCEGRACAEGGLVCVSGACTCTASIEFCNDTDEDCDGVVDDGCPSSIATCCATSAGSFGSTSGSVFSDPCPTGTVLMGMAGRASARVDQLQPICASLVIETDRSGRPDYAYPIRRGAAILGATHGGAGGTGFDDRCPNDDVVIGIYGSADDLAGVGSIVLRCGRVSVARSGLSWRLSVTPTVDLPMRGGASSTPFASDCGTGAVSQIDGRADTIVERIGITCEQLQLQTL